MHNPGTRNRPGPDVGSQYRSAIFCHAPQQLEIALAVKAELNQSRYGGGIVTQIAEAATFWPAEDYHQKYVEKHPGSCHV